jgi:hypothetical protein
VYLGGDEEGIRGMVCVYGDVCSGLINGWVDGWRKPRSGTTDRLLSFALIHSIIYPVLAHSHSYSSTFPLPPALSHDDQVIFLSSVGTLRTKQVPFNILNLCGVLDAKRDSEELIRRCGSIWFGILIDGEETAWEWGNDSFGLSFGLPPLTSSPPNPPNPAHTHARAQHGCHRGL